MGQSLSEPRTEKHSLSYENDQFLAATSSMQGWRIEMEDAYCIKIPLCKDSSSAFFAVFDGHGGRNFADYCSQHLHEEIVADENFREGNILCAIRGGFLSLDRKLQDGGFRYEQGGTTAISVLFKNNKIYCGNVGDSRAIASVGGVVQELSRDHKPTNPQEESRIYRAGGWVELSRVNGNLALSRAFGDFNFKTNKDLTQEDQIVTADPEIMQFDIPSGLEFIVLACDGIWDVMSNKEVVDFVRQKISEQMNPVKICESILDRCLAPDCRLGGVGCDNMTIIIVCFLNGKGYSDLGIKCNIPVDPNSSSISQFSMGVRRQNSSGNIPSGIMPTQSNTSDPARWSPSTPIQPSKLPVSNGFEDCSPCSPLYGTDTEVPDPGLELTESPV